MAQQWMVCFIKLAIIAIVLRTNAPDCFFSIGLLLQSHCGAMHS